MVFFSQFLVMEKYPKNPLYANCPSRVYGCGRRPPGASMPPNLALAASHKCGRVVAVAKPPPPCPGGGPPPRRRRPPPPGRGKGGGWAAPRGACCGAIPGV